MLSNDILHHDERIDHKKIKLVSFISFLLGFSQAMLVYVLSTYFSKISGTNNVSVFYLGAYAASLMVFLNAHKLIKKLGKSNVLFFSIFLKIIAAAALVIFSDSYWGIILAVAYVIFEDLAWVFLDIVLESCSADRQSGRIRGLHLTILNAGFLAGPYLSTFMLRRYDFSGIFLMLVIFNAIAFSIALLSLRSVNHRFDQNLTVRNVLSKIAKRQDIVRIYIISCALEVFYALVVVYTPLYLESLGFSLKEIGIIFTVMLVPFVFIQYPVGILADKKWGEKELIISALILLGISTSALFFIDSSRILIWAGVLFATRTGAALIELLRDSYFYKRVDGYDVDIISFFRTARSVSEISAAILVIPLLFFLPIKFVFIVVGIAVFFSLFFAFRLEDNENEKTNELSYQNGKI